MQNGSFNPQLNPLPTNTHNQVHQFPHQNPTNPSFHHHHLHPLHSPQFPPQNPSINHPHIHHRPHLLLHQPHKSYVSGVSDYEQRLRDEVIYLHSLWRRGPPQNPHLKPRSSTKFKKKKNIRNKALQTHLVSDKEWPVETIPTSVLQPGTGWGEFKARPAPNSRPATAEEQARMVALRVQLKGLDACIGLFRKPGSENSDDEDEDDDEEDDYADDCDEEFEFLLTIFEGDGELRGYYEKNCENGEFYCLVCGAIGNKLGRMYKNCVALIQHSVTISKTKKRKAHRAYGQVVCKVLGWDINRLPSLPAPSNGIASAQSLEKPSEVKDEVKNPADGCEQNHNFVKLEADSANTINSEAEQKNTPNTVDKDSVNNTDERCDANELVHSESGRNNNADGCEKDDLDCFKDDRICIIAENVSEQDNLLLSVQGEVNSTGEECSALVSNSIDCGGDGAGKHLEGPDQRVSDSGMNTDTITINNDLRIT